MSSTITNGNDLFTYGQTVLTDQADRRNAELNSLLDESEASDHRAQATSKAAAAADEVSRCQDFWEEYGEDLCIGYYIPETEDDVANLRELDKVLRGIVTEGDTHHMNLEISAKVTHEDTNALNALKSKIASITTSIDNAKRNMLIITIETKGDDPIETMRQKALLWDEVKDVSIDNITAQHMSEEWLRDHHRSVKEAYDAFTNESNAYLKDGLKKELYNTVDVFSNGATNWAWFGKRADAMDIERIENNPSKFATWKPFAEFMSTYWTEQAESLAKPGSSETVSPAENEARVNLSNYYSEQFQAIQAALDPEATAAKVAEQAAEDKEVDTLIEATARLCDSPVHF